MKPRHVEANVVSNTSARTAANGNEQQQQQRSATIYTYRHSNYLRSAAAPVTGQAEVIMSVLWNTVWYRHPTKASAYRGDQLVAEVRPAPTGVYTSDFEVEVFGVTRRGCATIEDGVGMARAILAGVTNA